MVTVAKRLGFFFFYLRNWQGQSWTGDDESSHEGGGEKRAGGKTSRGGKRGGRSPHERGIRGTNPILIM